MGTWIGNKTMRDKIAFQEGAYRPLVDRISQHALRRLVCLAGGGGGSPSQGGLPCRGVVGILACTEAAPPCNEFLIHATENITLPQTLFAGGNNRSEPHPSYGVT